MTDDKRRFEDLAVGETVDLGSLEVSAADIIAFAQRYDPQPMHTDPVAAERSQLKGLAASGWQTCALATRLYVLGFANHVAQLGGAGVDECRWIKPLYPAERAGPMSVRLEIEGLRPSRSRPEMGLAAFKIETLQRDPESDDPAPRLVCLERFTSIIARREPGPTQEPSPASEPAAAQEQASPRPEAVPVEEGFAYAHLDEVVMGRRTALGEAHFTADEIIAFARAYDPQWFHLDAEAAKRSFFGGLAASGWEVACRAMRLIIEGRMRAVAAAPADRRASILAGMGPSPGFRDLRWTKPTYAGDTLRYYSTPTRFRRKPHWKDWVVLHSRFEAENQRGELVAQYDSEVMLRG